MTHPADPLPAEQVALMDTLVAFHHPIRRRLHELLSVYGPMTVGDLAARSGLAPGSVSHHLKPLHRAGCVEPAPHLARDTRESWWSAVRGNLSWNNEDFAAGSAARQVADLAERANLEAQVAAITAWMNARHRSGADDTFNSISTDTLVLATPEELDDVGKRLTDLIVEWYEECRRAREEHPDVERVPVRVMARAFPSDPADQPPTSNTTSPGSSR